MNYSFCTAVGVVESFNIEIQTDIKIPVAEVSIYSKENREWNAPVCVAIVDDSDKKKAQSLNEGDIIFFTGRPTCMEGNMMIFATSFIILKKNKIEMPLPLCKVSALEYMRLDNVSAISGKVCSVSEKDSSMSIIVKGDMTGDRGCFFEHEIVRVIPTNDEKVEEGDDIVCIGKIKNNGIEGTVAILKSTT